MQFINKYLRSLLPYKLASHKIWEATDDERNSILKLDWNEATIPPSPKVKERLRTLVEKESIYFLYPSTNNKELLSKLSEYTSLPVENIQYFASSDSLHEYLVKTYVSLGDPVLILGPTYDNFRLTCEANGARIIHFEYDIDFLFNEVEFIRAIEEKHPSFVYLCNPNNPTGTSIPKKDLVKVLAKFPEVLFLVDEAYFEFSGVTMSDQVFKFSNLFVTRTFSKAFALANFRAGYLLSDALNIQQISKIRNPKNISTFTQEAVIGSLSDIDYMRAYADDVIRAREWFSKELGSLNYIRKIYSSEGNFVLVDFVSFETKTKVFIKLSNSQIFVRDLVHSDRLINSLRFTIGTSHQMRTVLSVLKSFDQRD
jgi:histidinol-phosphate aminotransferase